MSRKREQTMGRERHKQICGFFFKRFFYINETHTYREREAETQAEGR